MRGIAGAVLGAFAAALLAAGCCYWEEHRGETNEASPDPLLSTMQLHYLDLSGEERRKLFRDPEFRTEMKSYGDKPRGVVERVPRGVKPKSLGASSVGWSLRRADSGAVVDSGEAADSFVVLSNLMAGTRYVLAFQAPAAGAGEPGGGAAAEVLFSTSDRAPRLLDIPGGIVFAELCYALSLLEPVHRTYTKIINWIMVHVFRLSGPDYQ